MPAPDSASSAVRYVDAAIAQLRRLDLMRSPGKVPPAMRDPSIAPSDDWVGWRPVPSTVTDEDLDGLERETGLRFPPAYREFLQYQHFVTLTELGVCFDRHLVGEWQETLRQSYFSGWPRERIIDRGLLPFGSESLMDAGPVCFDTRSASAGNDWPVVFWDHEWVGTSQEVRPMFSSCERMFQCLRLVAERDVNFVYHDKGDDPSLLARKQEMLRVFLATDPDGAGGAARDYWTGWGVPA
jgi:hypothetical protein